MAVDLRRGQVSSEPELTDHSRYNPVSYHSVMQRAEPEVITRPKDPFNSATY